MSIGEQIRDAVNDVESAVIAQTPTPFDPDVNEVSFITGENPSLGTTEETIWTQGGNYPWDEFPREIGSGVTLTIESDNALDTEMTFTLVGLDENGDEVLDQVTTDATDATTPITAPGTWYRVRYMFCTGHVNAPENPADAGPIGNISLKVQGTGTTVLFVEAGAGQSQAAVYTVPASKDSILQLINVTVDRNNDARIRPFLRPYQTPGTTRAWISTLNLVPVDAQEFIDFAGPEWQSGFNMSSLMDIEFRGAKISGSGTPSVNIFFKVIDIAD